ncbi:MAG: hypothetical protein PHI53_03790 [Candidatus Pacebacteria bacterium]|nr:hypothetical protein [Candidatus Paceibacterota bacterium]
MKQDINELEIICHEVRRRVLTTILQAGSGHIGGSLSSLELMVVLYFGGILKFDPENPINPERDRVLVRGHLGPLRYSIFSLLGWIKEYELATYRSFGSRLQGHECMEVVPGVDITPSGMLGMLLSYGTGAAVVLRRKNIPSIVWTFLGDGEEQEGNVSEAARYASNIHLNNLVCIMDRNKKQLSQMTSDTDGSSDIITIWRGYGWSVRRIKNGNSITEILRILHEKRAKDKPTIYIADTTKGRGLRGAEQHPSGYHTISVCSKSYVAEAIAEEEKFIEKVTLEEIKNIVLRRTKRFFFPKSKKNFLRKPLRIHISPKIIDVFEDGLVNYLQKLTDFFQKHREHTLYIMTADVTVKDLAHQCGFDREHVCYIDVGIREQHLMGMAHGISVTDPNSRIVIVEGDPFIFRAIDQIHAISQARSKMIILGCDSGLFEARNGSTHQTTGQPGALLSMPGMTLLEPADLIDLKNCFNWALTEYSGPAYLRLHSGVISCLPVKESQRNIVAYVVYQPVSKPKIILVASGFPVIEAVKTAEKWAKLRTGIKVVNVINMKEINQSFANFFDENTPILTIYNGNPFILQSAVAGALAKSGKCPPIILGHGFTMGTSGKLDNVLKYFQLDGSGIENTIKRLFPNLVC